jgi:hypothetical protein
VWSPRFVRTSQHRGRILLALILTTALLVICAAAGAFWLGGGRWMTVTTPSMGQTAPVGTLLLTDQIAKHPIVVGEFITFHPPGTPQETYAHRVVSIGTNGGIRTKGDLNGAIDPWTLHRSDVTGEVISHLQGVGWLVRALPALIIGTILVIALCHWCVSKTNRLPAGVVMMSLVIALTLIWFKPLVRQDLLSLQSTNGRAEATIVNTGLLPLRAHADGAGSVVLEPGQKGTLERPDSNREFRIDVRADLSPLMLSLLILWCLLPLAVLLLVGADPRGRPAVHRAVERVST